MPPVLYERRSLTLFVSALALAACAGGETTDTGFASLPASDPTPGATDVGGSTGGVTEAGSSTGAAETSDGTTGAPVTTGPVTTGDDTTGALTTGVESTGESTAAKCGGVFSTDWCPQVGTKEQFTRCESVANGGKTCNNPLIKYGTVEGGVPANHGGNNFSLWCTQLGFAGFSGQVSYGSRLCDPPQGQLFGCASYDENVWHWCDWQDGSWYNQVLDYHVCNDGTQITSVTCQ